MPELFREFADYRMPIYALALIIVMIVRPQGLFGIKELWDTAWWRRLIGTHGNGTPRAVARQLSSERAGGDPATDKTSETGKDKP
jgi:branched-chain amino acid transport system permease protein